MDAETLRALSQSTGTDQGHAGNAEQAQEAQSKREAEENMKRNLLSTVLDPAARERCG
jgi:DNA-binding TFAR19-related protein (PDSD5 family)